MTALSDLLAQAADIACAEGQLWLANRIGADLIRLDAMERGAALPRLCALDELPFDDMVHAVAPGATVDGLPSHRPVRALIRPAEVSDAG